MGNIRNLWYLVDLRLLLWYFIHLVDVRMVDIQASNLSCNWATSSLLTGYIIHSSRGGDIMPRESLRIKQIVAVTYLEWNAVAQGWKSTKNSQEAYSHIVCEHICNAVSLSTSQRLTFVSWGATCRPTSRCFVRQNTYGLDFKVLNQGQWGKSDTAICERAISMNGIQKTKTLASSRNQIIFLIIVRSLHQLS